jgi:hypothetical protein
MAASHKNPTERRGGEGALDRFEVELEPNGIDFGSTGFELASHLNGPYAAVDKTVKWRSDSTITAPDSGAAASLTHVITAYSVIRPDLPANSAPPDRLERLLRANGGHDEAHIEPANGRR